MRAFLFLLLGTLATGCAFGSGTGAGNPNFKVPGGGGRPAPDPILNQPASEQLVRWTCAAAAACARNGPVVDTAKCEGGYADRAVSMGPHLGLGPSSSAQTYASIIAAEEAGTIVASDSARAGCEQGIAALAVRGFNNRCAPLMQELVDGNSDIVRDNVAALYDSVPSCGILFQ